MASTASSAPFRPDDHPQETAFEDISDNDDASEITTSSYESPARRALTDIERRSYGSVQRSLSFKLPAATASARAIAPDLVRGLLMAFMAIDHNTMALGAWQHGTGRVTEEDGAVVHEWNYRIAYAMRTLAHFCAPGFTFLLGMGIVYFGRSRTKLGWSASRMVRHFLVRAVVLTLVSMAMGGIISRGAVWVFNIILIALAVDYFLVGVLWVGLSYTEVALATLLSRWIPDDEAEAPLLVNNRDVGFSEKPSSRAESISWTFHNMILLVLTAVTIWWNMWMSPTHGYCLPEGPREPKGSVFLRFWFYQVMTMQFPGIVSGFPPLAWISFAILGVLYGRLILRRSWSATTVACANLAAALAFSVLFVLTRVLRFGNLSENCLQTSDQLAHPQTNPYLASVASFFYVVKYPPDVAFFAFTLAGTFLLLALFTAVPASFAKRYFKVLLVFGTSALFFYVTHMFLLFAFGGILVALFGYETDFKSPMGEGPGKGIDNVWVFFANWAAVLFVLYFACMRYSAFKSTKGPDSIWKFF
ncbi:Monocarboxylate transporter 8 [Verticillium dahliae VDG2]|nr:Monocarboxylate transporter 8 [Verticillium dahliae VDG2]